jgi:hypothetical protein
VDSSSSAEELLLLSALIPGGIETFVDGREYRKHSFRFSLLEWSSLQARIQGGAIGASANPNEIEGALCNEI